MPTQHGPEADATRRLAELERGYRRLRTMVLALLLALVVGVCLWLPPLPVRTVVAETFVVRDASGQRRAILGLDARGAGAELTLHDGTGSPRIRLSTDAAGSPRIVLLDRGGRSRAALRLAGDGSETR